jgi:hypothetical protein
MTNILALPEVTVTMVSPRGDTWMEGLRYYYSNGIDEISLDGITWDFFLYKNYTPTAVSVLHFSTLNYANISGPGVVRSVISWSVPNYIMRNVTSSQSNFDFRGLCSADGLQFTAMTGTLTLT